MGGPGPRLAGAGAVALVVAPGAHHYIGTGNPTFSFFRASSIFSFFRLGPIFPLLRVDSKKEYEEEGFDVMTRVC